MAIGPVTVDFEQLGRGMLSLKISTDSGAFEAEMTYSQAIELGAIIVAEGIRAAKRHPASNEDAPRRAGNWREVGEEDEVDKAMRDALDYQGEGDEWGKDN